MTQVNSEHSTAMPADTPQPSLEVLAARLATRQRARERALRRLRKLRVKARAEIDRLLEFLDASDIDPDLEPSLGWPISGARSFRRQVILVRPRKYQFTTCSGAESITAS
jgi:hypothetical protein